MTYLKRKLKHYLAEAAAVASMKLSRVLNETQSFLQRNDG